MRQRIAFLWLAILLAFTVTAHSGPPQKEGNGPAKHPIDAWLEQCTAKDESTAGQLTCLGEAFGKWDTELNRVYKALAAKLPEAGRTTLRTAQLAWLKFRDEEMKLLDAFYDPLDGSMYRLMKAADRVDLIRKRALELASYLDVLSQL